MEKNINDLSDLEKINVPFDIHKVDDQCIRCIREQVKKYEKYIFKDGTSAKGKFFVECGGIPKDLIDPAERALLTNQQIEDLESISDPVKFAKKYIKNNKGEPWIAREPHQVEVLRCRSKRKALRISRRGGKTAGIVVDILYNVFTTKKLRVLIIGPQKKHTQEIFNRVKEAIYDNPVLAASVVKDVTAPHPKLVFKNGSEVRGFAGGSKGKGEGLAVRGEDADKIFIEEAAYVEEESFKSVISPILYTTPDVSLTAFSTPSPFKNTFFQFCKENPFYKEFYYSYRVLPWWREIEKERENLTEDQFNTEYEAIFPEGESGVFKPSYVDKALTDYTYDSCFFNPIWKYTMGVDWNEIHGTEIVVKGYDPTHQKSRIVDAKIIESTSYTMLKGVDAVIEMNKKWRPIAVYADAGNGASNIELLHKKAEEAKLNGDRVTANLLKTLKKYDSGSNIKVKDPITKEDIKKQAKSFMVNAAVRLFEQKKIEISAHDNILEKQLRNYIIERISSTGNPVYGLEESKVLDHRLDAMNLACVAFQLECNDLHRITYTSDVAAAMDPRIRDRNMAPSGDLRPEARDIEEIHPLQKILFPDNPQRMEIFNNLKSSRLGWQTDTEKLENDRMNHRRLRKQKSFKKPPRRSTF